MSTPRWVQLEHDGLRAELRHPWWVKWLVLWIVPAPVVFVVLLWGLFPELVVAAGAGPGAGVEVAAVLVLISVVSMAISAGLVLQVNVWTAPVWLRVRGEVLTVVRRANGRTTTRQFSLPHTMVYGADDHTWLQLVMDDPATGRRMEERLAMPVQQRSPWLLRALRGSAEAARQRGGQEATEADVAAMEALMGGRADRGARP